MLRHRLIETKSLVQSQGIRVNHRVLRHEDAYEPMNQIVI